MTGCKNNFLQVSSKLAKKHGVKSMVAVCPIEHDFATSESEQSFVEQRNEAENKAIQANNNLTLLRPNLVYGDLTTQMVHFMTQCAMAGKAPSAFIDKEAKFNYRPVHHDDLSRAIQTAFNNEHAGQSFSVAGSEEMSIRELMGYLERAAGKDEGTTVAKRQLPFIELANYIEEFFTGITHDANMVNLLNHYEANPESFNQETNFFEAANLEQEHKVSQFYKHFRAIDENFVYPTFGAYKCASLD